VLSAFHGSSDNNPDVWTGSVANNPDSSRTTVPEKHIDLPDNQHHFLASACATVGVWHFGRFSGDNTADWEHWLAA
jgi:hypothetical protein